MMNIGEVRSLVREKLKEAGIESYEYDTWALLEYGLGIKKEDYYMDPGAPVDEKARAGLESLVRQRQERKPLQYITGETEFFGYPFLVNEHVLIPRMDTECLVERAGQEIRQRLAKTGPDKRLKILDLCTGSGCIGISLKLSFPEVELTLSDLSEKALETAARNAGRLGAEVWICQSDLFEDLEGTFDLIISNPPYIPSEEIKELMPEVRDHEPGMALDGREDGLFFYRRILKEAGPYLEPGGRILFEIGAWQGQDLCRLFEKYGYEEAEILRDLSGYDRVACACFRGRPAGRTE